MKLVPRKIIYPPIYMVVYWMIMWAILGVFITYKIFQESHDGVILKRDCIRYQNEICTLSSRLYTIPVSQEFVAEFVGAGIVTGGFVMIVGFGRILLITKVKKAN